MVRIYCIDCPYALVYTQTTEEEMEAAATTMFGRRGFHCPQCKRFSCVIDYGD